MLWERDPACSDHTKDGAIQQTRGVAVYNVICLFGKCAPRRASGSDTAPAYCTTAVLHKVRYTIPTQGTAMLDTVTSHKHNARRGPSPPHLPSRIRITLKRSVRKLKLKVTVKSNIHTPATVPDIPMLEGKISRMALLVCKGSQLLQLFRSQRPCHLHQSR